MVRILSILAAAVLATTCTASSTLTSRPGYCYSISTIRNAIFTPIARNAVQSAINYLNQVASTTNDHIADSLVFTAQGGGDRHVKITVEVLQGGIISARETRSLFEEVLSRINGAGGVPQYIAGAIGGVDPSTQSLMAASVYVDLFQGSQELKMVKRDYPPKAGESIHEWCEDEEQEDKRLY